MPYSGNVDPRIALGGLRRLQPVILSLALLLLTAALGAAPTRAADPEITGCDGARFGPVGTVIPNTAVANLFGIK